MQWLEGVDLRHRPEERLSRANLCLHLFRQGAGSSWVHFQVIIARWLLLANVLSSFAYMLAGDW